MAQVGGSGATPRLTIRVAPDSDAPQLRRLLRPEALATEGVRVAHEVIS